MVTIMISAQQISAAYLGGRKTGAVMAPDGLTSHGRPILFLEISRSSRRITLSGVVKGHKWVETFPPTGAPIDD